MAPRLLRVALLLLFPLPSLFAQEEIKGAPAEPADAAEVPAQISPMEKLLPPCRTAALRSISWRGQNSTWVKCGKP
jgi:hypothetical protein